MKTLGKHDGTESQCGTRPGHFFEEPGSLPNSCMSKHCRDQVLSVGAIHIAENPTYVILDLGCTRAMESRAGVKTFCAVAEKKGIYFGIAPSNAVFGFANSQEATCR